MKTLKIRWRLGVSRPDPRLWPPFAKSWVRLCLRAWSEDPFFCSSPILHALVLKNWKEMDAWCGASKLRVKNTGAWKQKVGHSWLKHSSWDQLEQLGLMLDELELGFSKQYLQPRVETWLLGARVSVSVSVYLNPDVRFQFWFGFTAVKKSVPVSVSILLTRSFGFWVSVSV